MDKILRFLGLRYATAVLVVAALAALYGVASLSRPGGSAEKARAAAAPVTSTVMVCPAGERGRLSLASSSRMRTAGRADVVETHDGTGVASLGTPGAFWMKDGLKTDQGSYTVRASGALAPGLEAERTIHWPGGADRGLAGTQCARPATDMWFVGPGPMAAERIELYLTNVDAQPASVDVIALSGEGPLDTTEGRGIPVDPYTTKIVRIGDDGEGLGDVVAMARDLSLRVRATTGRVAAAVRVRIDEGKGIEWLPQAHQPATSVVVPGVPGGSGRRQLLVAVPGEADARVRVQVVTPKGSFAPQGQDVLDAPAETVTALDLGRALSGKPAAVRLQSDRPIVAGFAAERGADVAYGAATRPLGADGGLVADNRFAASLLLTAPDAGATVRVTPVGPSGAGNAQEVKVPAGGTAEAKLSAPQGAGGGYAVLVAPRPGSGPVYAARVLATGKGDEGLVTVLPVNPAWTTMLLPPADDSQRAVFP
ncbi:hypothetical protein Arub01_00480 [Actinomadura rubrobrunea]|uniref:Uncharacterized protein n=1 Tax=Actinomadura rubrobrunea TaxID=115335 RepID=A0A9W6USP4_9ACTN|nr:DUF5719 family protein [Actinomadura rubrobrunea]GLW61804.1 hypothetical protein Arub01_00480 [Actinomadura rubrobrunea]